MNACANRRRCFDNGLASFKPPTAKLALLFMLATVSVVGARQASGYPVDVTLAINPAASSLKIKATALGFSDNDTQSLGGTLNVTLDFGQSGSFPSTAHVTVNSAAVAPSGDYHLTLGFPPILGVAATASGLVADVTTPAPPATMTLGGGPNVVYSVDAAQFLVTLNQGTINVTGAANQTIDLAMQPVSGSSPPGTLGAMTFTPVGAMGPYTRLDAALSLPVVIKQTVPIDTINVDLEVTGTVSASATFYVALAGVAGDFDLDGSVDGADLTIWRGGFGTSTGVGNGDANGDQQVDGADLLIWQRNFGLQPPPAFIAAAAVIPEPATLSMAIVAAALARRLFRRRALSLPSGRCD